MATFLILDGHSLAFRAWFALQEAGMKTSSGQETQAVYGFVSMVTKLLDDFAPDGMAVAFDLREPTFRDEIAHDYKLGRPPTPDPLVQQIELIRTFVEALGVPALDAPGYEADDVLGTLAGRLAAGGDEVIVVTGDRDCFQLVEDPGVRVLYNRRGVSDYVLYDEAGIAERTGVEPAQYPLLAALRGDTSDNLPGVPGVGEKTAAKLVNAYGDIDSIFAHLDECTPKLRQSLADSEEQVRRNLLLTPIVRDVPLVVEREALAIENADRQALDRLFAFLEMRTLRERLDAVLDGIATRRGGEAPTAVAATPALPVRLLGEDEEAAVFLAATAGSGGAPRWVVLEPTYAGAPGRSAIEALAILADGGEDVGIISGELLGEPATRAALTAVLAGEEGRRLRGHRVKELMRALAAEGLDVRGLELDTAVAAYLVDPANGPASLEDVAARLNVAVPELVGATPPSGQLGFDLAGEPAADGASTLAGRAELVAAVAACLVDELAAAASTELYEEIERPLIRVLAKMECAGIGVDGEGLRAIATELTSEAKRLESEIHAIAGEPFNVNSTAQLRVVLYDKLGLAPVRKTKTGYSTDAATLERLRGEHEIVDALLRYREVEKLRSTYGEGLLAEVAPDGRIHASFNQTVARTGRLSSDQPNLHNIPVRSDEGRRFRAIFVPAPGAELLVADYNQIELRVIAHLSNDPGLVDAFAAGRDIHAATAERIFAVDPGEVSPAQRAKAKMVSYGLAYGMEAYGLSQRLAIAVEEAAEILEQYFVAFPAVRAYMDDTVAETRRRGYTVTERGRRRYLPELTSDNYRLRQAAERQAMNAGIQGLAADIFKLALVRLDAALESEGLVSRIVLQVHDEVLVEVPAGEHGRAEELTLEAMRNAYPLTVPLEVNLAWGATWADAKHS